MIRADECEQAIRKGIAFLQRSQLASGEFQTLSGSGTSFPDGARPDPSNFTTMHVANSLLCIGSDAAIAMAKLAGGFLFSQMLPGGLWKFWTRHHPGSRGMPPDTDDTACIAHLLGRLGFSVPDSRCALLTNRNSRGLFYTWILPRPRSLLYPSSWKVVFGALLRSKEMHVFFSSGTEPPDKNGVDAVVNANALLLCGRNQGASAVVGWLSELIRQGRAFSADRWYQSNASLFYAVARCIEAGIPGMDDIASMVGAAASGMSPEQTSVLDRAQLLCVRLALRTRRDFCERSLRAIFATQQPDGSWRAEPHYFGGYARARAWGSAELTTGFCVEAIDRYLKSAA